MTTYGYIRTSRDQEPGHPGSDPQVQRRQLVEAGMEPAQIYADVAVSGAKGYNSRDQWHRLDSNSPEAFMGNVLASMAAYVVSQERQIISRRTRAGLDAAREKGVQLGRPRRLADEQLIAIRQDVEEGMPVAAVARKYGVPRSTLRSALGRTEWS